jgi:hypothetical protein
MTSWTIYVVSIFHLVGIASLDSEYSEEENRPPTSDPCLLSFNFFHLVLETHMPKALHNNLWNFHPGNKA